MKKTELEEENAKLRRLLDLMKVELAKALTFIAEHHLPQEDPK